jgi:hypothetical protein
MNEMDKPCCAHLNVAYDPIKNENGTLSDNWRCTLCDSAFISVSVHNYLLSRALGVLDELQTNADELQSILTQGE